MSAGTALTSAVLRTSLGTNPSEHVVRLRNTPEPLRVTYLHDIAEQRDSEAVQWLVPNLFPRGFVTMLSGAPTIGKTFLMQMLQTASWSADGRWFGYEIEPAVRSYALYSEDLDGKIIRPRFRRICEEYGVDPLDVDTGSIGWVAEHDDGRDFRPLLYASGKGPTPLWDQIAGPNGHCDVLGCGLLILDNASTVLDVHDSASIYAFCALLKRYAASTNSAVVLLHHPPKAMTDFYSGPAWAKTLRHLLSLERPKSYDPYTKQDADRLLLRVAATNLPGDKPTVHIRWRENMLELADAPETLRARMPLSTSERADLDLRVLTALRYELGRGHRVLSDPTKPESLFNRLRKSASWQHVPVADLESSIDRLISRGQIIVDKSAIPSTMAPAS